MCFLKLFAQQELLFWQCTTWMQPILECTCTRTKRNERTICCFHSLVHSTTTKPVSEYQQGRCLSHCLRPSVFVLGATKLNSSVFVKTKHYDHASLPPNVFFFFFFFLSAKKRTWESFLQRKRFTSLQTGVSRSVSTGKTTLETSAKWWNHCCNVSAYNSCEKLWLTPQIYFSMIPFSCNYDESRPADQQTMASTQLHSVIPPPNPVSHPSQKLELRHTRPLLPEQRSNMAANEAKELFGYHTGQKSSQFQLISSKHQTSECDVNLFQQELTSAPVLWWLWPWHCNSMPRSPTF